MPTQTITNKQRNSLRQLNLRTVAFSKANVVAVSQIFYVLGIHAHCVETRYQLVLWHPLESIPQPTRDQWL
jgi:hypothetical protein